MEERFEVTDRGAVWRFPARGRSVLELLSGEGEVFFRLERAKCGKFGELSALPQKFRLHHSADGASAELEMESVIPFGCEYRVARECRVFSGVAELISDFSAVNFGKVDGIELEPVVFSGTWTRIGFLLFGEEKFRYFTSSGSGVLYSGPEPPLMVRVEFGAGRRCEFALGADVWRHRGAIRIPGAHSEFELRAEADCVRLTRRVLIYEPEVEPERRSWRYSVLIGWDDGVADVKPDGDADWDFSGCAMSPSVRRKLRHAVRRSEGPLVWRNVAPGVCVDPSHVGRAGKDELEHFDLAEYLSAWRWANRELARRGYRFSVVPSAESIFSDSVIMGKLAVTPDGVS